VKVNIISNGVEEEDFATRFDGGMMESDDEEENTVPKTPCPKNAMMDEEKEGTKLITPRTKMGSNDNSNTPRKIGSTQYV
jgi:hypothetical protein